MLNLKLRDKIQKEAEQAFYNNNCIGSIFLGVGGGKSVIAINIHKKKKYKKVLLVGDTRDLVNKNWKEEYLIHTGSNTLFYETVTPICYKSLSKYDPSEFDFIILDEGDKLSYNNVIFLEKYLPKSTPRILLTGTPPSTYGHKGRVIYELFPELYRYLIDESAGKITNDFEIVLHQNTLSTNTYYKKFGNKKYPTSEFKEYTNLTNKIDSYDIFKDNKYPLKTLRLWRKQLLNNLRSKVELAKYVDKTYLTEGRCLIFAPTIPIAEELCGNTYHSQNKSKYDLFKKGVINKMSCVDALNRGHSLNVDKGLILRLDSTSRDISQKLGRLLRTDKTATLHIIYTKDTVEEQYLIEFLEDIGRPELIPEYLC